MATLDEARQAQAELAETLAGKQSINGIGLMRVEDGWCVQVNLAQPPAVTRDLPSTVAGVNVRYKTIGAIVKR